MKHMPLGEMKPMPFTRFGMEERIHELEAAVERLKAALVAAERRESVVNRMADEWARKGGGRESGRLTDGESVSSSEQVGAVGSRTAAAYPAALTEATVLECSECHAYAPAWAWERRKEASP